MCLDEIYISLVLETFNDMLFELHQDKTFCKSVVTVSTNVSIEWLDVPIVVSSVNTSAEVLVSERGRSFTQIRKRIGPRTDHWGTPEITSFISEFGGFVENVCLKKTMKCQCYIV